jgi:hypothetical protein
MSLAQRLSIAVCLALGVVVCLPAVATADLFPAGNYNVTTTTADTFVFTTMPPYTQASVFVQDTTTQANPLVGPSITTRVVQLSVFWSGTDANGNPSNGNGCSLLSNPSDFQVASGTSTANLETTLTGSEQPCDQFEQVLPAVTVSANWTSISNRGSGRTSSTYTCSGYRTESLGTSSNFSANATFSLSALPGSFSDNEASLASGANNIHAQGTLLSSCIQPGGKGAGPGPQAPGRYTFHSNIASFSQAPGDQSDPQVGVFVNRFTNTTIPQGGGAPTTTNETDVNVFVGGSAGFGFGCFVVQSPSDFTINSNLASATLHTHIDSSTMCQPSFGNFPFVPMDISITWTGVGPVTTSRSNSQGSCGSFSEETFFNDVNNNATATATLSFFPGITFSGGQSFLGTTDHSFQIQGASRCPGQ